MRAFRLLAIVGLLLQLAAWPLPPAAVAEGAPPHLHRLPSPGGGRAGDGGELYEHLPHTHTHTPFHRCGSL